MNHKCDDCSNDSLFVKEVILAYCGSSASGGLIELPGPGPNPGPGPDIPPEPIGCTATYYALNEYDARLWKEPRDYFIKNADFYGRLFEDHYSGSQVDETYFLNVATRYAKSHSVIYGLSWETRPVESAIGIEIEGNFIFADYNSLEGSRSSLEDMLANSEGTREINYPGLPTYPGGTDVTRYFIYFWGYLEQRNPDTGLFEPMNNGELMIVGSSYLDVIPLNELEV